MRAVIGSYCWAYCIADVNSDHKPDHNSNLKPDYEPDLESDYEPNIYPDNIANCKSNCEPIFSPHY